MSLISCYNLAETRKLLRAIFRETTEEILPGVEHRQHKRINNRAENSHQPTRQQEKQMRKFKSPKQAQRFLSIHGQIRNLFGDHRYKMAANDQRMHLISASEQWQEIVVQAKYS